MKKSLFVLVLSVLGGTPAWAQAKVFPVQGIENYYCQREPGLYDRISDDNFVLTVVSVETSGPYAGYPRKIDISTRDGRMLPGEGIVEHTFVQKNGNHGYREVAASYSYNLSTLICQFTK
ncbi:hypothetical protein EZJ49_00260 [Bdellovibrio bacteriovorus]|uniref:hypothetical protein n=1 Tax=Bdellovibrio bacteriovorus TaxID=959 RepID=UPI0021D2345E|nr:hypothetical protein [Bdellovibrio bacteriovorus]UXR64687.1 hypothetical protein EZJ49_00260 [Bdellovibrio bacteriovorus]